MEITNKQIGAVLSGIALLVGSETFIGASILEDKIQDFARPEIVRIVNHTADSILSIKKVSFRSELAERIHIQKDSVAPVLSGMIQQEIGKIYVGFFIDKKTNKLKYQHSDGEIYRPIKDNNTGRFYFVTDAGVSVWCY